jgi:hypothetical protein
LYSWYCRSRSASRTFWTITCFADCAAMRPKSNGGRVSEMASPICAAGLRLRASEIGISRESFSTAASSTTSRWRDRRNSPVLPLISAWMSVSAP